MRVKKALTTLVMLAASTISVACGPNDRLRDNYWGKETLQPHREYQPVNHDNLGNPILRPEEVQEATTEARDQTSSRHKDENHVVEDNAEIGVADGS